MNLKLVFVLFSFALLTGCDKLLKPLMIGQITGTGLRHDVVLVIGQSNNVRFEQYGEAAFSDDYQRFFPGSTVQFINCAVGGTSIDQWMSGGQWMNQCLVGPAKPTVILFYQGEADAYLDTTNWASQFISAAIGWRKMFGEIPIIYAQIAVEDPTIYCPQTQWDSIKLQQTEVLGLRKLSMIKTDDISTLDADPVVAQGVHLSAQSYVNIAGRYMQAFAGLISGNL